MKKEDKKQKITKFIGKLLIFIFSYFVFLVTLDYISQGDGVWNLPEEEMQYQGHVVVEEFKGNFKWVMEKASDYTSPDYWLKKLDKFIEKPEAINQQMEPTVMNINAVVQVTVKRGNGTIEKIQ